jgi:hypothetical protein
MTLVVFPANEYDEVLSGYQPCQTVDAQPFDPADSPRELHHTLFFQIMIERAGRIILLFHHV